MTRAKLKLVAFAGHELNGATLKAMYELRCSVVQSKPSVDLASEYEGFCRFCRKSEYVRLLYSIEHQLVGSVVAIVTDEISDHGVPYVLCHVNHMYLANEHRGHWVYSLALFGILLRVCWRSIGRQLWFCGIGYPNSFLHIGNLLDYVYMSGDLIHKDETPPIAAEILQNLISGLGSGAWDSVRGVANRSTLPHAMSERWQVKVNSDPMYLRYIEYCPDWRNGYSLPGCGQVKLRKSLWRAVMKIVRRLRRS